MPGGRGVVHLFGVGIAASGAGAGAARAKWGNHQQPTE